MLSLENLINSGQWAIAIEKGLALVSAYSEIEFGEKYSASERFRKWFRIYAIDKFDSFTNDCYKLKECKINGHDVTKSSLESISLNEHVIETYKGRTTHWENNSFKLEHILYKIRCTDFHTQSRMVKDITVNGKNPIFRLSLNEDNIFKYIEDEHSIIYLCPQFFCWLILCSIDSYNKTIPTKEEAVRKRYDNFIDYNVDSVEITLKANLVMSATISCNFGLRANIAANKSIEISEEGFTAEHNNSCIEVKYAQISECKVESDHSIFLIEFIDTISTYTGLSIDLTHPMLDKLKTKLIAKGQFILNNN